jgi:hypothetical protein
VQGKIVAGEKSSKKMTGLECEEEELNSAVHAHHWPYHSRIKDVAA